MRPKVYFSKNQKRRIKAAMLSALMAERILDGGQIQALKIERRRNKEDGTYWMLASGFTQDEFGNKDRIWVLESDEHLKRLVGLIKAGERR